MRRTLLCLVAIAAFNVIAAAQNADEVKVETGRLKGVPQPDPWKARLDLVEALAKKPQ